MNFGDALSEHNLLSLDRQRKMLQSMPVAIFLIPEIAVIHAKALVMIYCSMPCMALRVKARPCTVVMNLLTHDIQATMKRTLQTTICQVQKI